MTNRYDRRRRAAKATRPINVLVTPDEHARIKQAALWADATMSAQGRALLLAWALEVYHETGHADEWPEGEQDDRSQE